MERRLVLVSRLSTLPCTRPGILATRRSRVRLSCWTRTSVSGYTLTGSPVLLPRSICSLYSVSEGRLDLGLLHTYRTVTCTTFFNRFVRTPTAGKLVWVRRKVIARSHLLTTPIKAFQELHTLCSGICYGH